jgi:hypothetical protein
MRHRSTELWAALAAMIVLGAGYVVVVRQMDGVPAASGLLGHGLGVIGIVLMLMTETLYSLRKRSRLARWGRTSSWLRFHIFTGLVGPFLVLLHTSWKFNGLAGVVMLLTGVVVLSGVIGRYIYTAVPRTADGVALEAADLDSEIASAEAELQQWLAGRPESTRQAVRRLEAVPDAGEGGLLLVLGRGLLEMGYRREWQREQRQLDRAGQAQARELDRLLRRRRTLERQRSSLAAARRLLATWHTIHIPIGMVLFAAAFVHAGAAIYYATLLR